MPAITQLTRWKGGDPEKMIAAAKKAKVHSEKHGCEFFRIGRFHTGNFAGEWLVASRYPSWAAYAKAQEALAADAEYQKLLAHVGGMAEMTARNVVVNVEI